ncbi:MAG: class II fructose-bisphosphate aldolase [Candidatus Uhrbacteria bacterium]
MIADTKVILQKALRGQYAVGAFNVNNLEFIQAVVAAAERARAPVILQTSEGAIQYAGMEELVALMRLAARCAQVPIGIHLDHGKNLDLVRTAIGSGYTSVMYDGSALPYAENVANTKKVVKWARAKGVAVEAELGAITGVEDLISVAERDAAFTNPEQALNFVKQTGCDFLAVAIGTAHGAHKSEQRPTPSNSPSSSEARSRFAGQEGEKKNSFPPSPLSASDESAVGGEGGRPVPTGTSGGGVGITLDIPRLRRIHALLPKIPLVLHGASSVPEELIGETEMYCSMLGDCKRLGGAVGIPDKQIRTAIAGGIAKINTDTDLRIAFVAGLREAIIEQLKEIDPRKLLAPARQKIQEIVEQRIRVFGSHKKA